MFCPRCGTQSPEPAEYCAQCGTPFRVAIATRAASTAASILPIRRVLAALLGVSDRLRYLGRDTCPDRSYYGAALLHGGRGRRMLGGVIFRISGDSDGRMAVLRA